MYRGTKSIIGRVPLDTKVLNLEVSMYYAFDDVEETVAHPFITYKGITALDKLFEGEQKIFGELIRHLTGLGTKSRIKKAKNIVEEVKRYYELVGVNVRVGIDPFVERYA